MGGPAPAGSGGMLRRVRIGLTVLIGALAAVFLALTVAAPGSPRGPAKPSAHLDGALFPKKLRAAPFSLLDQAGRRATLSHYAGRVVVLSFMYSHCTTSCPLMATEIRGALNDLPNGGRNVPVLAISVDPAHDTGRSARRFLAKERLTGRARFLLGTRRQLAPTWKRYGIQPEFDPAGRQHKYGHSSYVMLIDRRGFLRVGFPVGGLVPEDLAHDLRLLLAEPA